MIDPLSVRISSPLFFSGNDVLPPKKARELTLGKCSVQHARSLISAWHSRHPNTQRSPWQYAFNAEHSGITYAVALWHNPSARMLPQHWLELRRMAVSDDAPHCTASWMLGAMRRFLQDDCPEREKLISYQDMAVHEGTIYRAAGWVMENVTKARQRDRTVRRPNGAFYRWDINGDDAHSSAKARWAINL